MKDGMEKFMYPVIDNFVTDDKIRYRFLISTKVDERKQITISMIDRNVNISFTIDGTFNKKFNPRDVTVSLPYIGKVRLVLFMIFIIPPPGQIPSRSFASPEISLPVAICVTKIYLSDCFTKKLNSKSSIFYNIYVNLTLNLHVHCHRLIQNVVIMFLIYVNMRCNLFVWEGSDMYLSFVMACCLSSIVRACVRPSVNNFF